MTRRRNRKNNQPVLWYALRTHFAVQWLVGCETDDSITVVVMWMSVLFFSVHQIWWTNPSTLLHDTGWRYLTTVHSFNTDSIIAVGKWTSQYDHQYDTNSCQSTTTTSTTNNHHIIHRTESQIVSYTNVNSWSSDVWSLFFNWFWGFACLDR